MHLNKMIYDIAKTECVRESFVFIDSSLIFLIFPLNSIFMKPYKIKGQSLYFTLFSAKMVIIGMSLEDIVKIITYRKLD